MCVCVVVVVVVAVVLVVVVNILGSVVGAIVFVNCAVLMHNCTMADDFDVIAVGSDSVDTDSGVACRAVEVVVDTGTVNTVVGNVVDTVVVDVVGDTVVVDAVNTGVVCVVENMVAVGIDVVVVVPDFV